jgi:CBS-domain-containing membrane protein
MSDIPHHGLQQTIHDRLGIVGDALDEGAAAAVAIAVSGVAAYLFHQPLLFPALGPIAFLCLETPLAPAASPRNTFIGNGVAIVAGYVSLLIFGQLNEPSVLLEGVSLQRAASAAVSVALTVAVLVLLRSTHAPAGATALLISLGFLDTPSELLAIAAGVILLTVVIWIINRILGVPVPVWAAHEGPGWPVADRR